MSYMVRFRANILRLDVVREDEIFINHVCLVLAETVEGLKSIGAECFIMLRLTASCFHRCRRLHHPEHCFAILVHGKDWEFKQIMTF